MINNYKILSKLGIENPQELKSFANVKFLKLKKIKDKNYELYITANDFLPINELDVFLNTIKNSNGFNFELKIKKIKKIIDANTLYAYINFILKKFINNLKSSFFSVTDFSKNNFFKFDTKQNYLLFNISINFINELQETYIKEDFELIKNYLNNFGIDINLKIKKVQKDKLDVYKMYNENITINKEATLKLSENTNKPNSNNLYSCNLNEKKIIEIRNQNELKNIKIQGRIFSVSKIETKKNLVIYVFSINDETESIQLKTFAYKSDFENLKYLDSYKNDDYICVIGNLKKDTYTDENVILISKNKSFKPLHFHKMEMNDNLIIDSAKNKRIELHTHTKMSTMDGIASAKEYLKQAFNLGHNAVAITDYLNVQAFPEIHNEFVKNYKDKNFKVIYGSELNMINKNISCVFNPKNYNLHNRKYVIFDLETTGLSPYNNQIIEFGAVIFDPKTSKKEYIDILIKPTHPKIKLSAFTKSLTHLSDEILDEKGITIEEAMKQILDIFSDSILVAHNAVFDMSFIHFWMKKLNYKRLTNTVIDTLPLAKFLFQRRKSYALKSIAKINHINYDENVAHRADYDADVLCSVFSIMLDKLKSFENDPIIFDNQLLTLKNNNVYEKTRGNNITVLVKNKQGLFNLFKLITISHTESFYQTAKIFKKDIEKYRKNLLIGSGVLNSEVFNKALNVSDNELEKIISFYDYIEIQPPSLFIHLYQQGEFDENFLQKKLAKIIEIANKLNKLVVVTATPKYLTKKQYILHEVYINSKQIGGKMHPLYDSKKRVKNYPIYDFKTTNDLKNEFMFLNNPKLVEDIVVNNPKFIVNQIEQVFPIKDKLFTPVIDNCEIKLKELCFKNAHRIYGTKLPEIVEKRLNKELNSIIKHGFAVIYWIAHKLVSKSINDGYLVGSRGSVGSSLVATLANITEINPLIPHYICSKCKYNDFNVNKNIKSGFDLADKNCPKCNSKMYGEGQSIPFETFLGFEANKVPDIDLNFSSEYQHHAHNFIKEMFGESHVLRAGTISTVAKKTAFGYVKNFIEEKNISKSNAEIERISQQCEGVKRTTGQHPGGIIIIPKEFDVNDFTPVNYPADDKSSLWKTTHFDFHAIHDNVLKLDVLGHIDPTALKILHNMTGIDPKSIPKNDRKVLSLFSTNKELNFLIDDYDKKDTGALGIPEFGTKFVREMLKVTRPKSFAELVQISGLSHGTNVWVGNAKELIEKNNIALSDVIGCRDDIMTYLISNNIEPLDSFNIMESVRKGRGINDNFLTILKNKNIPNWYIESCQKIKYMFPKAHAAAYVLMAWRIAWYKLNYPAEYYATFFSTRTEVFDIKTILQGSEVIKRKLQEVKEKIAKKIAEQKEKDLVNVYEVAVEMWDRGVEMVNIDLSLSGEKLFNVYEKDNKKIIVPPFTAIDGLGVNISSSIINERNKRKEKNFISVEDFRKNTSITKTHLKILEDLNVFSDLPQENQLQIKF